MINKKGHDLISTDLDNTMFEGARGVFFELLQQENSTCGNIVIGTQKFKNTEKCIECALKGSVGFQELFDALDPCWHEAIAKSPLLQGFHCLIGFHLAELSQQDIPNAFDQKLQEVIIDLQQHTQLQGSQQLIDKLKEIQKINRSRIHTSTEIESTLKKQD